MMVRIQGRSIQRNSGVKVPSEILKNLRKNYPNIEKTNGGFFAYRLAHEGEFEPSFIKGEQRKLYWPNSALKKLSEGVKKGTNFYIGHAEKDNDDLRIPVGTIEASYYDESLKGTIIVGHFPDKKVIDDMDVCSMEAVIELKDDNIVDNIIDVTAIALENGEIMKPAFSEAKKIGEIACEEENKELITLTDVQRFIREQNVTPGQIYTFDAIKNDINFQSNFSEINKVSERSKEVEKLLEEEKSKRIEAEKALKVDSFKERFKALLTNDLTEAQKTFMERRVNNEFLSDKTDEELKEYIQKEKEEFSETAKLFKIGEINKDSSSMDEDDLNSEEISESSIEDEALKYMGVI